MFHNVARHALPLGGICVSSALAVRALDSAPKQYQPGLAYAKLPQKSFIALITVLSGVSQHS